MLERSGGTSFLTPVRSAFFIFKGMIVLLVGHVPAAQGGGGAMRALSAAPEPPRSTLTLADAANGGGDRGRLQR
jgi:hypothetical protein